MTQSNFLYTRQLRENNFKFFNQITILSSGYLVIILLKLYSSVCEKSWGIRKGIWRVSVRNQIAG